MRDEPRGPRPLSESLRQVASRIKRLDLLGFAAVEAAWPAIAAASPSGAVPVRLSNGQLVVAVASGAHAARARRDVPAMLEQLTDALADPPTSVRVTVHAGR